MWELTVVKQHIGAIGKEERKGYFPTFGFPVFISTSIPDLVNSSIEKIINV